MTATANAILYMAVIMVAASGSGLMIEVGQDYFGNVDGMADETLDRFLVSMETVSALGIVDNTTGNVTELDLTVKCGIGCEKLDIEKISVRMTTEEEVRQLSYSGNETFDYEVVRDLSGDLENGLMRPGDLATITFGVDLEPGEGVNFLFMLYPTGSHDILIVMPDTFSGKVVTLR